MPPIVPTQTSLARCEPRPGVRHHPTPLGQAFAEYGAKTLHLLAMIDPVDDTHRRAVNTQTTVQESRHKLARTICHGKRGQIYQTYREGHEDQLAALGLVVNAVVLWNTRYLGTAVDALREQGQAPSEQDVAPAVSTRARSPQLPRPLHLPGRPGRRRATPTTRPGRDRGLKRRGRRGRMSREAVGGLQSGCSAPAAAVHSWLHPGSAHACCSSPFRTA